MAGIQRAIRVNTHELDPNGNAPSAIGQKQLKRAFDTRW